MASSKEVLAVVTGGNKGIGFEIARGLARRGVTTVLTARDAKRGQDAAAKLAAEGHPGAVVFHELEVTSPPSAAALSAWLAATYGGLDVLVNNAGVFGNACDYGTARTVIDINYYGTKTVTTALQPHIRAGGRVINVASGLGELSNFQDDRLRAEAAALDDFAKVDDFVERFVEDMREGRWREAGWPTLYHSYTVSKTAQLAYTRLLAAEQAAQPENSKFHVNAICPGYCATDLNDHKGHRSAEEGADTAVWLALLPAAECPQGGFYRDQKPISF